MNLQARLLLTNFLVLSLGLNCPAIGVQSSISDSRSATSSLKNQGSAQAIKVESLLTNQKRLVVLLASFLVVGTLNFWLLRSILLPLRRIEQTAKRFSAGDLSARIPPSPVPEIRHLELTLNSVADRLQGVEERRQAVIGDLAHEIGTPLTVICGYLGMLKTSELEHSPDVQNQLHQESQRMMRLLDDLKILSKVEAGNLPLQLQSFSPLPAMEWVIKSLRMKGWQNDCELELDCPEPLPRIFADIDRFKQILTNLISNGLTYTLEGSVRVRAWAEQEFLRLEVQDTGIGIAPEELPFVFDRFWRSKHSRHLRVDGSGIGLAITKRLVEAMGGGIEVDSQLEEGTTFSVSLPLDSPGKPCAVTDHSLKTGVN